MAIKEPIELEEWSQINEQELTCILVELGRNMEIDFDREADEEFIYNRPETYKRQFPQLIW